MTLGSHEKVTCSDNALKVAITAANGMLKGTVKTSEAVKNLKTVTFHGVILQKQNAGAGFFLGTNQSGVMTLASDPFGKAVLVTVGQDTLVTNVPLGQFGGSFTVESGPLAGLSVNVPAGALLSDATVSISQNGGHFAPQSGTSPGYIINLQVNTNSATFQQPVSVTITYPTNQNVVPVPFYVATSGSLSPCQVVSMDTNAGTLTFQTYHASLYTWVLAHLVDLYGTSPSTTYEPNVDGFQVGNPGSIYNSNGECFGICAFEQWYFDKKVEASTTATCRTFP